MFDDQKKVKARRSEGQHKKKTLLTRCFLGKVDVPPMDTTTGDTKSATKPVTRRVIVLDNDNSCTCCAVTLDEEAGKDALCGREKTIVPMLENIISACRLGFQRGSLWDVKTYRAQGAKAKQSQQPE
jgi:hypothetical protein